MHIINIASTHTLDTAAFYPSAAAFRAEFGGNPYDIFYNRYERYYALQFIFPLIMACSASKLLGFMGKFVFISRITNSYASTNFLLL